MRICLIFNDKIRGGVVKVSVANGLHGELLWISSFYFRGEQKHTGLENFTYRDARLGTAVEPTLCLGMQSER